MRTIVLSDLHLGNGGIYDVFAGGDVLPALLEHAAATPTRVVLNGDTVDFLLNDDPLEMDIARAVSQAEASVSTPSMAAVLRGLGTVLAAGGEAVVRLGNHDAELALAEVQAVLRRATGQPDDIAARLTFVRGNSPQILDVGRARILITHGEHDDMWNRLDYQRLPGPGSPPGASHDRFAYPPGSRLVKTLLNPLKRRFRMRFADILKPDFCGAVLTALAIAPAIVKLVFQGATFTLLWQLFRQKLGASAFADEDEEDDLGLADAIDRAGLTPDERDALIAVLHSSGALAFDDEATLNDARLKLARAGLGFYARCQRAAAGAAGERFFALDPEAAEWNEATRLAKKYGAGAVIVGHTHAARWRADSALTFVNTGTWIHLARLPPADAGDAVWMEFLESLRRNPELDQRQPGAVPLFTRFTGAVIEPSASGARLALVEWRGAAEPIIHGETQLAAAP
jgi:UDP-2,3-diacylglucosamine pyrophosphatase LpxH